jgi:hypothetical protein
MKSKIIGGLQMKFQKTKNIVLAVLITISITDLFADLQITPPAGNDNSGSSEKNSPDMTQSSEAPLLHDVLRFDGNYSIPGKLISISPEKKLLWQHPDVDKAIEFKTENIREIILSGGNPRHPPSSLAAIKLTNGDIIKGEIESLDEEKIIVKTWYSDNLKISRKMLKEIHPTCVSTAVYEGPKNISEWMCESGGSNQKVQLSNKTLIIPGNCSAGRDMKLPDMAKIEFDIDVIQNSNFNVALYSDKTQRHQSNAYILNIAHNYIYLQRFSRNERSDNIAQGECRQMMQKRWPHFEILVNKKEKNFTVMVNGSIILQCKDIKGEFVGRGGFLTFYNYGSGIPAKIKNITVSQWDGRLLNSQTAPEDSAKDNVVFNNDDKITGQLKTIEDGQAVFETDFAPLNVPIARIKSIKMSDKNSQTAAKKENDLRLFFDDGEFITIAISSLSDGKIEGTSENLGKVKLDLGAFKKIKMNIYNENLDENKPDEIIIESDED